MKARKNNNGKRGFTMAELLVVVGIIGILSAVAFVAVAQHQRNLERVERDSVAREIFVAAQNHLTMAKGLDYLGLTGDEEDLFGKPGNKPAESGVYYFAVTGGAGFSADGPQSLLDLMLPFGAIDETVRVGGSYIIRYHKDSATVLDVFYCSTDSRFGYDLTNKDSLDDLFPYADDNQVGARRRCPAIDGNVLGWYGGEAAKELFIEPVEFDPPEIYLENAEKLIVGVVDNNKTKEPDKQGSLHVILTGASSGVKKEFIIRTTSDDTYYLTNQGWYLAGPLVVDGKDCDHVIVLDDITTSGLHFTDLKGYPKDATINYGKTDSKLESVGVGFWPGEDISVYAEAFDNTVVSNIVKSTTLTTNSLFEKVGTSLDGNTAFINNIRHLENLDKAVSNLNTANLDSITAARQTTDLSWGVFKTKTNGDTTAIYPPSNGVAAESVSPLTSAGCYYPLYAYSEDNTYQIKSYNGQNHNVTGIVANQSGDVGMFSTLKDDTTVANLALIDFSIDSTTGNAGALAGTLTQTTNHSADPGFANVSNVVAYNSTSGTSIKIQAAANAGGLIGQTTGQNARIDKSAASLIVLSTGAGKNAGGFIGTMDGGTVEACYSGGHVIDNPNGKGVIYDPTSYNVTATGENAYAGGLIGSFTGKTSIRYSYSTCSVSGAMQGGFVGDGEITESSIKECYSAGLVDCSKKGNVTITEGGKSTTYENVPTGGAFAYRLQSGMQIEGCHYFEIINEYKDDKSGFAYLSALGNMGSNAGITALDADADAYNLFVGDPSEWTAASAYNAILVRYYRVEGKGKYNLQSVKRLGATLVDADFVATHYGDWPAPETFIMNEPVTP